MTHSEVSIDNLIREGTSLKEKLGKIAQGLECTDSERNEPPSYTPIRQNSATGLTSDHIRFISPLPGGLKDAITEIFSMICSFEGVDHGGIYLFDRQRKRLDLVCHYNLSKEFLARVITFTADSWQVKAVRESPGFFNDVRRIPLTSKILYEQFGIREIAMIPLVHRGRVIGCINLGSSGEELISGFEELVIKELALRISRTVALHLAQVRLMGANEELAAVMQHLNSRFSLTRPPEQGSINCFFAGMRDEIERLGRAITTAIEMIMQKLEAGQKKREFPYHQKKVDTILHDMDVIIRITVRLRVFCMSQSETLERGILHPDNRVDASFMASMVRFYHALEALVMDDKKQRPAIVSFIAGQFASLSWPVNLSDLDVRINRLTPN